MDDKKEKTPLTSQDHYDMDVMAEAELSRLQRQFRIMEGDRKAFTGATAKKFDRQEKMIQIWTKEHANIMKDLKVSASSASNEKDRKIMRCLKEQLDINTKYAQDIIKEKKYLSEINYQINKVKNEASQMRKLQITDVEYERVVIDAENKVKTLENKLETSVKKFCIILHQNRQMREEIDHLLKQRVQFNKLWEKLINNLNYGKKYMLDLIEQATIAYGQRDEWCMKLQAVRLRTHNDFTLHCEEMRELQRKLDHYSKLQEFLRVKSQKRIMKRLEEKEAAKRQLAREELNKKIEMYRMTLTKIKEVCKEDDFNRLADNYLKQEEENFALFNYVNELNHELETLSDSIAHLQLNIDEQIELNKYRNEQQNNNLIILKKKLEEETEATILTKEQARKRDETLEEVFAGIKGIFNRIKCDSSPILKLLGDNTVVNKFNVIIYLELIEETVSNLIAQTFYHEKHTKVSLQLRKLANMKHIEDVKILTVSELVPKNPCPLCIESEFVEDYLFITVRQIPLTREQVAKSLINFATDPRIMRWVHMLTECYMPAARALLHKRYNIDDVKRRFVLPLK